MATQAEDFVESGMLAFDEGDWKGAALAFDKALKLDENNAQALAGLALVLAEKEQTDKAFEFIDKAMAKNPNLAAIHTAKGRVLIMSGRPDALAQAIDVFNKALSLNPGDEAAYYYKAVALLEQEKYDAAARHLNELLKLHGFYMQRAAEKLQFVQKLKLAAPRTESGKKIMSVDAITRADLATLLVEELNFPDWVNKRNPHLYGLAGPDSGKGAPLKSRADLINDISGHWAASFIKSVVRLHGMDIFPDHSFRPAEKVKRMDFALAIQQVLILVTGNRSLDTAFIGLPSPFPDVKKSHYAFNAILLATERSILQPNPQTGEFGLNDHISGLDALIALRKLEKILAEPS